MNILPGLVRHAHACAGAFRLDPHRCFDWVLPALVWRAISQQVAVKAHVAAATCCQQATPALLAAENSTDWFALVVFILPRMVSRASGHRPRARLPRSPPPQHEDSPAESADTTYLDCQEDLYFEPPVEVVAATPRSMAVARGALGPLYVPSIYTDATSPAALKVANDIMCGLILPGKPRRRLEPVVLLAPAACMQRFAQRTASCC